MAMKYCCVSHCKNDSVNNNNDDADDDDERKSFYPFPLHEPERLQQWLRNMGREDWTPSRHQYICHEHFAPSCFRVHQGIHYLENDAVPTVFKAPEKRKSTDQSGKKAKRLRRNVNLRTPMADNGTQPVAATAQLSSSSTVESSDTVDFLMTDLQPPTSVHRFDTGTDFPVTLLQTVEDVTGLDSGENTALVVVSQCPAAEEEDDLLSGITAAILAQHRGGLVVSDSLTGHAADTQSALCVENVTPDVLELSAVPSVDHGVIAYFETIPNVMPCVPLAMPPCAISPETVLSSALGSTPIVSTVPIVSKHTPPSSSALVLTMETLDTEGEQDAPEEDSTEQQENQLEEHCLLRTTTLWRTPTR